MNNSHQLQQIGNMERFERKLEIGNRRVEDPEERSWESKLIPYFLKVFEQLGQLPL